MNHRSVYLFAALVGGLFGPVTAVAGSGERTDFGTFTDVMEPDDDTVPHSDEDEFGVEEIDLGFDDGYGAEADDTGSGSSDEDGDGVNADEDCDDTNAQVYPGAVEIPGDGIDNDCDESTSDEYEPITEVQEYDNTKAEGCMTASAPVSMGAWAGLVAVGFVRRRREG